MKNAIAYLATVHLLIDAQNAAEADQALSALLTDHGLYAQAIPLLDWSYRARSGRFLTPRAIHYDASLRPVLLSLASLRHPRQGGAQ